jgi:hypothetical protein
MRVRSETRPGRCGDSARVCPWQPPSTAHDPDGASQIFEVTHPFHPLRGQRFALIDRRLVWGEDRVYYHDAAGRLCRICAQWTSLAEVDAFVQVSAGRSSPRVADLLQLAALITRVNAAIKPERPQRVKRKASSK